MNAMGPKMNRETRQLLLKAIREKRAADALDITANLLENEVGISKGPVYLLRGYAYELDRNLLKARDNYRQAAYLVPAAIPFIYLARVSIKLGGECYGDALKYLKEASAFGDVPEIDIAYGKIFETSNPPNYQAARHHYARVARAGRFVGFFGYSRVLRKEGRGFEAGLLDLLRILIGPVLLVITNGAARKGFWEIEEADAHSLDG